jgi:peroxiredoxin
MPAPYGGQSQQRWGDNTVNASEYLRDLMMTDLATGRPTGTADARRKGMVVLVFFNVGTPDCITLIPALQRLSDAYKESGKFTVLGVSEDDEPMTRAFIAEHGLKFPLVLDHDGYHAMIYGLARVPTLYFADASGSVLKKMVGYSGKTLNDISHAVANFAQVDQVVIDENAPMLPAIPRPEPVAAEAKS